MTAPGWYPDPDGAHSQRYFDGQKWTDSRAPAAPPPPKKSKTWLWVLLAIFGVILLFFIGCSVLVGTAVHDAATHSTTSSSSSSSGAASPNESVAPAGSAVRDGKFEFQVVSTTVAKSVSDPTGNPYMTATAQGEFIIVTLSVHNIGDQPANYFGQNQKLIDTAGRQFGISSDADLYMNSGDNIMGDINPGNGIQVKVAFDVPVGTAPAKLELHDSMFSGVALAPPK
jgi:Domain of unknown function (DUF4352)/Protein of unknown function (DUF2510)